MDRERKERERREERDRIEREQRREKERRERERKDQMSKVDEHFKLSMEYHNKVGFDYIDICLIKINPNTKYINKSCYITSNLFVNLPYTSI